MHFPIRNYLLALAFGCGLAGCATPPPKPPVQTTATDSTRNNCYSLLHDLLDQEKDLGKLRFFKSENADLKALVKRIATAAEAGEKQLDAFAKQDGSLALKEKSLPAGETKTRDSIGAAQEKELLLATGDTLELDLLLTQVEALNYASHLAKIAGENDFQPDRARYLSSFSQQMKTLHDEVVSRLALQNIPKTK